MKIWIFCLALVLTGNADALTKEEIAAQTAKLDGERAALVKRKQQLEADIKKTNAQITQLTSANSNKKCNWESTADDAKFEECKREKVQIEKELRTANEKAAQLGRDASASGEEVAKLDAAAGVLGIEKAKSEEKQTEQTKRFKLGKAFDTLRYDALALRADTADAHGRLLEFERDIDQTRLGLYTEEKLFRLLNDPVMCSVANQCKKGTAAVIGKGSIKNVFPGVPLADTPGDDRKRPASR